MNKLNIYNMDIENKTQCKARFTLTHFFFQDLFIYSERQREADTQAEGEAGSMQGARSGTRFPGLQDRALGQRQAPNR